MTAAQSRGKAVWDGPRKHERRDLTGATFGQFRVLREVAPIGSARAYVVQCSCGNESKLRATAIYGALGGYRRQSMCLACWRAEQGRRSAETSAKTAARKAAQPKGKTGKPRIIEIDPDIDALATSRQRKLQLQMKRVGRCVSCMGQSDGKSYCPKCRVRVNAAQRLKRGTR